jgi:hypothetical protein
MTADAKQLERIDTLYRDFLETAQRLLDYVRDAMKDLRLAKGAAFQMATAYVKMLKAEPNALRKLILTVTEQKGWTIDDWLDHHFAPVTHIGEDYRALIRAVQGGMTLDVYNSTTPIVFLAAHRESKPKKPRREFADLPQLAADDAPVRTQLAAALKRVTASDQLLLTQQAQITGLHSKVSTLERRVTQAKNGLDRIESLLKL